MSIANTSIVNKLLETESPSNNSKIKLANDINSAFLEPLQNYSELCPSTKIAVANYQVPHVTIESLLAEPACYLIKSSFQKQCLPTCYSHTKKLTL